MTTQPAAVAGAAAAAAAADAVGDGEASSAWLASWCWSWRTPYAALAAAPGRNVHPVQANKPKFHYADFPETSPDGEILGKLV